MSNDTPDNHQDEYIGIMSQQLQSFNYNNRYDKKLFQDRLEKFSQT